MRTRSPHLRYIASDVCAGRSYYTTTGHNTLVIMYSPRLLAALALLATVAALPASEKPSGIPQPITIITDEDVDDSPWFNFPVFGNLFAPLWKLLPSFSDIGPRIVAEDNQFKVIVNVKDYKKDDLKVKVKGDFIFVQGSHEAKQDDHDVFASQFFHTYTLPSNSSSSDVTAALTSDGFLVVNAPLSGPVNRAKETDREVPIVETGAPYQKEESTAAPASSTNEEKTEASATKIPSVAAEPVVPIAVAETDKVSEDRKEETTPSNKELSENNIPHGNEINP